MNTTHFEVVRTYTSRRWLVVAVCLGAVWIAFMLFLMGNDIDNQQGGVMGMNFLGLPLMIGGLLLAMQAKYQFVHSRARLTPGYARPHLVVLVALLVGLVLVYPVLTSWRLHYAPLGVLAFSTLFAALVVWQIQVMSGLLSLASLALYFSYFQPTIAQLWVADSPSLLLPRLALLLIGLSGITAWLWRLTQMKEEDSDYLVPVQSGFSQQSRMEKSEARHLVTRWISRSPVHRWVVDGWHDRLAGIETPSESTRPRLLRYGMWMLPMPLVAVQMLVMILAIASMQFFIFSNMHAGEGSVKAGPMMLGQFGILCMVIPAMACHLLATRRTRLGQDLLLPLSREALVDGLRRQFVAMVLWTTVPAVLLAVAIAPYVAAELLTPENMVAVVATALAIQPLSIGLSLRLALVQSGLQRMAGMILLLYLLMGVAVGTYFAFVNAGLGWGAFLALTVLALGIMCLRWAHNAWLNAELG